MPIARYYSSIAQPTTLAGGVSNANTSIQVVATTGFPSSYPYTLAVDAGTSSEELVDVTNAAGTTLTVTRGVDGTSAQSHSIGAVVRHVSSGRDFADFQAHAAATAGVHGVVGTLVGTSDAQTLANKTLTSPSISGATLSGTLAGTPTFSGGWIATGAPSLRGAAAANAAYGVRVTGDTQDRLVVGADGKHTWGSGAATGDTTLTRSAAGVLTANSIVQANRTLTTDAAFAAAISTDTVDRWRAFADGKHEWGPGGSTARDTNLYRAGVDTLRTDDTFQVGGVLSALGTLSVSGAATFNSTINLPNGFQDDSTLATTASTTYVNSSRALLGVLTVPPSGKVEIKFSVRCDNTSSANTLSDVLVVGSSSGTIYSPQDTNALQWNSNQSAGPFATARTVVALAGETLTVTLQHRVVSGTGNFRYRALSLTGMPI